ncbi:MAG: DUF2723 domain-containing protein [Candidatus Manganitrophus sp.]|nr:DUF2723 domain-containing protein [Candidatus Manganitrophus sp.]WDT71498.1 MAG: DUF2723 domain-containing protein [Candidatus Manganitrophus sp.]
MDGSNDPSTLFSLPLYPLKMAYALPLFIFFISFFTYLWTALPTIYWRDAPEFQAIGFLLDIAHPAGSPLYAVVAKLFTFIPIGSIAFKVTLVSSLFGAGIAVLIYFIMQLLLRYLITRKEGSSIPPCSARLISWIGFFTALVFSFSNALWENSNVPEVYTLQNFFTALFILIFIQVLFPGPNLSDSKRMKLFQGFLALSFLYGLSLGAHAILILYLPFFFFAVYFIWMKPASMDVVKTYSLLFFFFLVGFSIYLYLPIRSVQNPYYDWGNPETFDSLMRHVSDRKDASFHTSIPQNSILLRQFSLYLNFCLDHFSWIGVILGLIGLFYLFARREKALLGIFAIVFFPPFLFFIRYWGESSAFIPTFLVVNLLMGIGSWTIFIGIQDRLAEYRLKNVYLTSLSVLFVAQFFFLFSNHFLHQKDKANYWSTREIMKRVVYDLPPNAVVFTLHTWFGLNYLQQSEGYRPDITVLSISSFLAPDFFTKLESSRFPNIVIPVVSQEELGPAFLTQNVYRRPIYWEPTGERNYLVEKYLAPEGLLFRIDPTSPEINQEVIQRHLSNLSRQIDLEKAPDNKEEGIIVAEMIAGAGSFFLEKHLYEVALGHFKLADAVLPNQGEYLNLLGITYAYLKNDQVAEEFLIRSITANPNSFQPYLNLAEIYLSKDQSEKAETYFKKVLSFSPNHIRSLSSLGKISTEKGESAQALNYFQRILKINPNDEETKIEVDRLLAEKL